MVLPYEPIESDSVINIANPAASNPDLPADQMPYMERIAVTNLVGPTHANKQHKAVEKRSLTLLASLQRQAQVLAAIDTTYVRRDGTTPKAGAAGFTANIPANGFKFTGMGSGSAPGQSVTYDQLVLKADLASPTFTGTPTAPTASPGTATTQLATTAFVTAALSQFQFPTGEYLVTGSGQTGASGNFTVPTDVFLITALWVGGGGGGGANADGLGGADASGAGGGGGSGGARYRTIPVTPGQVIAWVLGAGGNGGPSGGVSHGGPGAAGGATTFMGIAAPGGNGGGGGLKSYSNAGGAGGTYGTSDSAAVNVGISNGTPGPAGVGTGGTGGGNFVRTRADVSGNLTTIGVGGAGSGINYSGGGSSAPATAGGISCGGGGRGSADTSAEGAPGGAGFLYITWG